MEALSKPSCGVFLTMVGQIVSHYRIVEKLGEGGMGAVYKAEDTKLHRPVALKCLPLQLVSDENAKERFFQEARASSALNHPNIATTYYMFEDKGREFICMEYVEGQTLSALLARGSLPTKQVLHIAIQVADGLSEAHKKGIVHRDIKSENVMITSRDLVKIMDFGLAKLKGASPLTKVGSTLGTLAYMSPEQAQGLEVDYRTDIFSLGVVLYEMLSGQRPFDGQHETAILYSILNEDPQPIEIEPRGLRHGLSNILHKALEKDRTSRYQTMDEMLLDLRSALRLLEGTPLPSSSDMDKMARPTEVSAANEPLDPEDLVGKTIGNYQIVEEIGRGGMGIVYKALQISLNRLVAIKVLPRLYTRDEEFLARFQREARAAASMNHPNIVHIHEIGQHRGIHFFVMEYIDGKNLKDVLNQEGPRSLIQAVDITWDICKALDFAHTRGIVHRDIKPHNIMISNGGETKVFDFGIARAAESEGLTITGTSIGTPQYMCPEQVKGERDIDGRADLYSLGVVLYEMLAGKTPFEGSTAVGTMYCHVNETPEPPSVGNPAVPAELDRIALKALQKEKEKRYQTGQELIDDLRRFKLSLQIDAGKGEKAEGKRRRTSRRFIHVAIVGVAVMAAMAAYYFGLRSTPEFCIESEPTGARVTEGDRIFGVTPLKMSSEEVGQGTHTFILSLPGYADEYVSCSVIPGQTFRHRVALSQSVGGLHLSSQPSRAQVVLDGVDRGLTPLALEWLKTGSHHVLVRMEQYKDWQDTVVVRPNSLDTLDITLHSMGGEFVVSSRPESAYVLLDSILLEKQTPCRMEVKTGRHSIRLEKSGFASAETLLSVHQGGTYELLMDLKPVQHLARHGSLQILATPWAYVFLDGKRLGSTQEKSIFRDIAAGSYSVRLTSPGYPDYQCHLALHPDQQAVIAHDFTATGGINISCIDEGQNPVFGEILINGMSFGMTPKVISDLPVGAHTLQVKAPGFAGQSRTVTIKVNATEKIQFVMKPAP